MIVMNPQGVMPVGPWQLPSEFARPNWTTLSSGSAQQILESRGLLGLGFGGYGAVAPGAHIPTGTYSTESHDAWSARIHDLTSQLRAHFGGGNMSARQREQNWDPYLFASDVGFRAPDGREVVIGQTYTTGAPAREGGDFQGTIFYDNAHQFLRSVAAPRETRRMPPGAPRQTRTPSRAARSATPARTRPRVQASRMAGYGMGVGAGARVVERLPWRRYAGQVDLY